MATAFVILGAGKGTRMNSDLPKVLHQIGGAPLLVHAMKSAEQLEPEHMVVVTGHGSEAVAKAATAWNPDAKVVHQDEQLGTAHAVAQARDALKAFEGTAIVLYGDTPFIAPETLRKMVDKCGTDDVVVLGFAATDPGRYGRLVTDGAKLSKIVEYKDATPEERAITLCNSGVIAGDAQTLFALIDAVGNENAAGEYYLTDIIGIARERGLTASVVACDESETLGINSRAELAAAEAMFQGRMRANAMEDGVAMPAPETIVFAHDTVIGRDATVEPHVVFAPGVSVESGATVRAFSHLEGCHVARGAVVGPYARLRPGAELSEDAKIGNFVEIKNAMIGEGAKVNHLSYIGDAEVGPRANIGAGTVTCNYDGFFKHRTTIGADAFIGSDTMLVAPVSVGAGAMTGSGSTITEDVPDGDLGVGRARQRNVRGFAGKLFARLKKQKEAKH
ncbi:UDP-N-acetylglucosamine pyrophosphorylase /glucosamine-1-phosphate N-acetyltransferase [Cognatiyoonia koreensis]|uniref:Bifunctional protein GlmU n=1 Tax=Cognatiyoonia koreensis TaxID=364200 RepID=A0A1I0NJP5_9RHOB|nr:bifunctional UDP-N-acetylglucosamine diphosphorylase/glucosamine-1-phosphate N-acetyltransferase GlmU [Cognatiyoonia koreensis]SEW01515.1 UDP-N-acetylglucosamine pyrophosphorylase /glucosamine-1-phosphate N-acetyltransferase [Cognatiyoonia koreensis]